MRHRLLVKLTLGLGMLAAISAPGRAAVLEGVVTNSAGHPAADAKVTAAGMFRMPPLRLTTQTDAAGRFRLDLPPVFGSERYTIAVRWRNEGADKTEGFDDAGKSVEFQGQALPIQSIQLQPGGTLTGTLRQAEDDAPIAGAQLFLDTGEVLTTDGAGQFQVSGLAMRDHSLIPVAPGRVREYVLFDTSLTPNATLDIRLPRGAVLRGRVVDETGNPIAGAFMTRLSSGMSLTLNGWDQLAADDGSYEYGGLSAERLFYNLVVEAPGFKVHEVNTEVDDPTAVIARDLVLIRKPVAPTQESQPEEPADSEPADSVPPHAAELSRRTLHGTIRSAFGEPVAAAHIRWGSFLWSGHQQEATSDPLGAYKLENVPSGNGAILVVADGYAPQFVPAREGVEKLDVALAPGVTLRGRVVNAAGKPVGGVHVAPQIRCLDTGFCNPIWLAERSTRTSDQGTFQLSHVAPGTTFDFLKDGYSEQRDVMLKPGTENDIRLVSGGALHGRVLAASGEPVTDFKVRLMIPREHKPEEQVGGYYAGYDWYGVRFTRPDGRFVISDVPAATLMRLVVTSPEHGVAIVDRAVSSTLDDLQEANDVTLRLARFRALNVNVTAAATGKPVPGALVTLLEDEVSRGQGSFTWNYDDLWASRTRADSAGSAHFARPACEDGTVIVRAPGFARQRLDWTGENHELAVTLNPGAAISGEVRVGDSLLSEGYVRLQTHQQDFIAVDLSETDGTFAFAELPLGECTLTVSTDTSELHQQKLNLVAGENPKLEIAMPTE